MSKYGGNIFEVHVWGGKGKKIHSEKIMNEEELYTFIVSNFRQPHHPILPMKQRGGMVGRTIYCLLTTLFRLFNYVPKWLFYSFFFSTRVRYSGQILWTVTFQTVFIVYCVSNEFFGYKKPIYFRYTYPPKLFHSSFEKQKQQNEKITNVEWREKFIVHRTTCNFRHHTRVSWICFNTEI